MKHLFIIIAAILIGCIAAQAAGPIPEIIAIKKGDNLVTIYKWWPNSLEDQHSIKVQIIASTADALKAAGIPNYATKSFIYEQNAIWSSELAKIQADAYRANLLPQKSETEIKPNKTLATKEFNFWIIMAGIAVLWICLLIVQMKLSKNNRKAQKENANLKSSLEERNEAIRLYSNEVTQLNNEVIQLNAEIERLNYQSTPGKQTHSKLNDGNL